MNPNKKIILSKEQQMYIKNEDPEEYKKYREMFRENSIIIPPIIIHGTKSDLHRHYVREFLGRFFTNPKR